MAKKYREKPCNEAEALRYRDIVNLYERLANGGIECSMTLDDENGICTIYCHGVELADNSERINKSFEDVLEEEEENDQ